MAQDTIDIGRWCNCITCGTPIWGDSDLRERRRESHNSFYCVNGHSQAWSGENRAEKAEKELSRARQQLAQAQDEKRDAERQAETEATMRRTADAAVKRLRKRASAGTCPCCNRTFGNMATHMKRQHPEFVAENVVRLKSA